MLQPIQTTFFAESPITWNRVHDLPDFVYFDHSAHVNKGVTCTRNTAGSDQMPLISRQETLSWAGASPPCAIPEEALGPREAVFAPRPQIRTKSVSKLKHRR